MPSLVIDSFVPRPSRPRPDRVQLNDEAASDTGLALRVRRGLTGIKGAMIPRSSSETSVLATRATLHALPSTIAAPKC